MGFRLLRATSSRAAGSSSRGKKASKNVIDEEETIEVEAPRITRLWLHSGMYSVLIKASMIVEATCLTVASALRE